MKQYVKLFEDYKKDAKINESIIDTLSIKEMVSTGDWRKLYLNHLQDTIGTFENQNNTVGFHPADINWREDLEKDLYEIFGYYLYGDVDVIEYNDFEKMIDKYIDYTKTEYTNYSLKPSISIKEGWMVGGSYKPHKRKLPPKDMKPEDAVKEMKLSHALPSDCELKGKTLNCKGNVNLSKMKIKNIKKDLPFTFGKVEGNFNIKYNELRGLDGSPSEVTKDFDARDNNLKNLEGGPKKVGGSYRVPYNNLTSLKGSPTKVGKNFACGHNNLKTLEGSPKEVDGNYLCKGNPGNFGKSDVEKVCKVKGKVISGAFK